MPAPALLIRPSNTADLPAITAIYGWNVLNGTGTFEIDAPFEAEMARRRTDVLANGLPWLVAQRDGAVVGFAYANLFRPRPAFRFCLEDSVYLMADAQGQGVGSLMLAELMARCEAAGARQMMAVIGVSTVANAWSVSVCFGVLWVFLRVCLQDFLRSTGAGGSRSACPACSDSFRGAVSWRGG